MTREQLEKLRDIERERIKEALSTGTMELEDVIEYAVMGIRLTEMLEQYDMAMKRITVLKKQLSALRKKK